MNNIAPVTINVGRASNFELLWENKNVFAGFTDSRPSLGGKHIPYTYLALLHVNVDEVNQIITEQSTSIVKVIIDPDLESSSAGLPQQIVSVNYGNDRILADSLTCDAVYRLVSTDSLGLRYNSTITNATKYQVVPNRIYGIR